MSSKSSATYQDVAPTAELTTEHDDRVLDLDSATPVAELGATVIYCDTYTRADNGNTFRFDSDVPVAIVGIYSHQNVCHALADVYDHEDIERAFATGRWLECERQDHTTEAIAVADDVRRTRSEQPSHRRHEGSAR